MGALRVCLFGGVSIDNGIWPGGVKLTRSSQSLLAYLLLRGERSHPREILADTFWGDQNPDSARGCLSTALWRLRSALEPAGVARGTYLQVTPAGEVSFNWRSEHWIDAQSFRGAADSFLAKAPASLTPADIADVRAALQISRGELLEGFYEDWALAERERMRSRTLDCLVRLMGYYKQQAVYDEALRCGERVLELDVLREDVHREMIRLHLTMGQRTLALRQYNLCRTLLADELGVPPMAETEALRATISKLDEAAAPAAAPGVDQERLQQAIEQINRAMHSFEEAQRELQRARHFIEQLTNQ